MFTLNCRGKLVIVNQPIVMGILNLTPDSFYKGYLDLRLEALLGMAENMIGQGAGIIDIGGQSTRPGSERIDEGEELKRVLPVIEAIHVKFPDCVISIDTYYSSVAREAVLAGASIVNDVSAGNMDSQMISTVAGLQVPYICMHMQGTPETMQQNPVYENVVVDLLKFFAIKIRECEKAGIKDIIIDPGFGFGKTHAHNFRLLKQLNDFNILQKPVLAGLSRKSMIWKTLGSSAAEALNGTTALNMLALHNGANILRVHDVKEAVETVKLFSALQEA